MAKIKVIYTGYLIKVRKKQQETYTIEEGWTVKDLINRLCTKHNSEFKYTIFNQKTNKLLVIVLVNGRVAEPDENLMDGDTVTFVFPYSGG